MSKRNRNRDLDTAAETALPETAETPANTENAAPATPDAPARVSLEKTAPATAPETLAAAELRAAADAADAAELEAAQKAFNQARAWLDTVRSRIRRGKPAARGPSMLDQAYSLLAETGAEWDCKTIIRELAERGLWVSPGGLTPDATLSAALGREIRERGENARFEKPAPGRYKARRPGLDAAPENGPEPAFAE